MVCCFLCEADLEGGTNKAKRRKLPGSTTEDVRKIIEKFAWESYGAVLSFGNDSYICYKCKQRVESLPGLLEKAENEKAELLNYIRRHAAVPGPGRKRPDGSPAETEHISLKLGASTPPSTKGTRQIRDEDFKVAVKIRYPSCEKTIEIDSPWTKKNVKRIARRSYTSLSSSMVSCSRTSDKVLTEVARCIRREMKEICSERHDSVLRDTHEGVKHFNWKTVWLELLKHMPTLVKLLVAILPKRNRSNDLISLIVCMILKQRLGKMALVQRVISILLYGNGCHKQVFNCLQPLMLCLSSYGSLKLVERLCEDYDVNVQFWSDELLESLKERISHPVKHVNQYCQYRCEEEDIDKESTPFLYSEYIKSDDESVLDDEEAQEELFDDELAETFIEDTMDEIMEAVEKEQNDDETDLDHSLEVTENTPSSSVAPMECVTLSRKSWKGFKIVGDNIDKNFRRSFQRMDFQTRSFHYFHSYAVLDRVDLSGYVDTPCSGEVDFTSILPTDDDISSLKQIFCIFVSRILVKHLEKYRAEEKSVLWHIEHQFSKEMGQKSDTVPLGIYLLNEMKVDEMCKIIEQLHRYVPSVWTDETIPLPNGEELSVKEVSMWETLFGGDQLTVARARGSIAIRANHPDAKERLEGLVPTVEDWHSRMTLMKVIWKRLYSVKSSSEKGTMFQLKNLINRTSVPLDPQDNMKAAEDFLELLLEAHVVTAAECLLSIHSDLTLNQISQMIVDRYVILPSPSHASKCSTSVNDGIHLYACELLSLGLIWYNYLDATREGDGDRVLCLWKFLLLVFKASNRTNYSKEAAILLLQCHFLLSNRKSAQVKYSRFVNTQGRQGCNIPCDLHMEHLNRRLKSIIRNMGSNIQPPSLVRAAKSVGVVHNVCSLFEEEMRGQKEPSRHAIPSAFKDMKLMVDQLKECQVFNSHPNRSHPSFHFKHGLLQHYNEEKLLQWLAENVIVQLIYK